MAAPIPSTGSRWIQIVLISGSQGLWPLSPCSKDYLSLIQQRHSPDRPGPNSTFSCCPGAWPKGRDGENAAQPQKAVFIEK